MSLKGIVAEMDAEIARLQRVRKILSGLEISGDKAKKKTTRSAEGRDRIAVAQKKRWAKVKRLKKQQAVAV